MDAILGLSEHVVRTGYRDLPSAAVGATKTFLQDTIGVGVAGSAGERFGGPGRLARAVDASLDRLATVVKNPGRLPELLFGKA